MNGVRVLPILVLGGLLSVCSVTIFAITQNGWMLGLKPTDDQCDACGSPASRIGTAFLNADGSVTPGLADANLQEHFRDVDGDEVLAKIARMPIREWNDKAQNTGIRHMGPTAQDFYAAFRLGGDPLTISTIDADGVALRGIQALEARTRTQHEHMLEDTQSLADQNDSLVQENAKRIAEIATLKADIAALRAALEALRGALR